MKLHIHQKKLDELKQLLPKEKSKPLKIFTSVEEALKEKEREKQEEEQKINENPELKELLYEIQQREKIVNQLQEVYDEMKLQNDLKDGESIRLEDEDGNVSYQWKKERKH